MGRTTPRPDHNDRIIWSEAERMAGTVTDLSPLAGGTAIGVHWDRNVPAGTPTVLAVDMLEEHPGADGAWLVIR